LEEDFEIIAVEVKGRDPKFIWEIIGIFRAPNEDMRVIERLAAQTDYLGNSTNHSIIGKDLNFPYADWNGNREFTSGSQAFVNRLVWENGYKQVVDSATRGDALLDVYLARPESSLTSCSIVQAISDHCGVLLEVECRGNCCRPQVERLVLVYYI
jgi:hypothetical protein